MKEIIVFVSVSLKSPDGDTIEKTQPVNVFVKKETDENIKNEVRKAVPDLVDWDWSRI